jgi:hypothetical protein
MYKYIDNGNRMLDIGVFINGFPGFLPEDTRSFTGKTRKTAPEYLSRFSLYLIYYIRRLEFLPFLPCHVCFYMTTSGNPGLVSPKNHTPLLPGPCKMFLSPGQT